MRADGRAYFPLKIVIAGGFGVGKTTMVQALSEIPPLVTEEALTTASVGLDDVSAVPGKSTTTVAMDFGRISMDDLVLYLFGTPGQDRFWFMWDELARGAVGAVVLVDLRRVDDCFPAIDFFESRGLPFVAGGQPLPGRRRLPRRRGARRAGARRRHADRPDRRAQRHVVHDGADHAGRARPGPVRRAPRRPAGPAPARAARVDLPARLTRPAAVRS